MSAKACHQASLCLTSRKDCICPWYIPTSDFPSCKAPPHVSLLAAQMWKRTDIRCLKRFLGIVETPERYRSMHQQERYRPMHHAENKTTLNITKIGEYVSDNIETLAKTKDTHWFETQASRRQHPMRDRIYCATGPVLLHVARPFTICSKLLSSRPTVIALSTCHGPTTNLPRLRNPLCFRARPTPEGEAGPESGFGATSTC